MFEIVVWGGIAAVPREPRLERELEQEP